MKHTDLKRAVKNTALVLAVLLPVGMFTGCSGLLGGTPQNTTQNTKVTGVKLDKEYLTLVTGKTGKLTASVSPGNAVNKKVIWSSANESVATVDQEGNIKALSLGETVITVKTEEGNKTANCTVKVVIKGAILNLGAKKDITISAVTKDGKDIIVEGCDEASFKSGGLTVTLNAKGDKVILKGEITELYCYANELTILDVQGLNLLEKLYCFGNKLTSIDVQGTGLKELDCRKNLLTILDVQGLNLLEKLYCSGNKLTSIDVQGLTGLKELYCYSNELTILDVQGLNLLEKLYCSYNKLTSIDVQGLTGLKELYCSGNELNADAFKDILSALPARTQEDNAKCLLFGDRSEKNYKFTNPVPDALKTAFEEARTTKHWALKKLDSSWNEEDITLP